MLSFLPIARRPIALTAYRRGSRGYGVLHAAPPRQYPGPGPITSSLMSIAGAAIVTWTFYKVIWDYRPTAKAVEPQLRMLAVRIHRRTCTWCLNKVVADNFEASAKSHTGVR